MACTFGVGGLFERFGWCSWNRHAVDVSRHELRDEISALREKDLLQLQDDFLALRSERSALRPGIDVPSMDHVQDLRDEISALWNTLSARPEALLRSALQSAVHSYVKAQGDEDSALLGTLAVSQKDLFWHRDDFFALWGGRSAVQCGVDVSSMEHLQQL